MESLQLKSCISESCLKQDCRSSIVFPGKQHTRYGYEAVIHLSSCAGSRRVLLPNSLHLHPFLRSWTLPVLLPLKEEVGYFLLTDREMG